MLGKMIKHEFKATGRLYLPLFLIAVVLTPLLALLFRLASVVGEGSVVGKIISGMSVFGYVVMLVGLGVAAFLFIVIRFYRTVATSEAYLTFCLPVKTQHVLISKLLVGVIWELLAVGIALGSILVMLLIQGSNIPHEAYEVFSKFVPMIEMEYGSLAFFFIHLGWIILVSTISGTLAFFLSICLGQLFNEHRVIASIGMYVAVYTVSQVISTIAFVPFLVKGSDSLVIGGADLMEASVQGVPTLGLFIELGLLQVGFAVAYFIGCLLILKKKTNVR